MAKFSLKADINPVQKMLKGLENSLRPSQKAAMNLIGDYVTKSVRENFLQGGRPQKWLPISKKTLEAKLGKSKGKARAKKASTNKVLIGLGMRGGLMGSIHYKVLNGNSVTIGPDKRKYAAIHQFGGKAGRGNKVTIPARPYLMLQQGDAEKIKRIIEEAIAKDIVKWAGKI